MCFGLFVAHVISVLFLVKGKGKGENVAVAMVRAAIVKHTLGRYPLPKVEDMNSFSWPSFYSPYWSGGGHDQRAHAVSVEALCLVEIDYVKDDSLLPTDVTHREIKPYSKPSEQRLG